MRGQGFKQSLTLFRRHQAFIRGTQCQLNSERRREQDIDFPRFNFLQIACGNLGAFGQFVLRHAFVNPLSAHVCAKGLDSRPFFFGKCHDTLHRFCAVVLNDTYIVKGFLIFLVFSGKRESLCIVGSKHQTKTL